MNKIIFISGLTLIIIILSTSCGDNFITPNREIVFPDSNVSYQNHVQYFLNLKCSYRGCHSAEDKAGGRDMTDYFGLFETANNGLIIKGEPDNSRMVTILRGNPMHLGLYQFPPGYFSENNVNGIITWIKEGALFN